jgi:hypothetical protein
MGVLPNLTMSSNARLMAMVPENANARKRLGCGAWRLSRFGKCKQTVGSTMCASKKFHNPFWEFASRQEQTVRCGPRKRSLSMRQRLLTASPLALQQDEVADSV